jgi:PKD repeat protein
MKLTASFNYIVIPDSLKIRLTDQSVGPVTNWYWTFGDGTFIAQQKASHVYQTAGNYDVCLFVSDDNANFSNVCKKIQVGQPACELDADFTYVVNADNNLVQFADRSFGIPTSWFWDFGDGVTSSKRNPAHTYAQNGMYQVKLSIRDAVTGCSAQEIKVIQVGTIDCYADFSYNLNQATSTVKFTDNSSDNVTTYFWSFGDGYYSVAQNPSHTYAKQKMYQVSLTVMDETGQCMDLKLVSLQVGTVECNASFTYYIDSLTNTTYFNSKVTGSATNLLWFFGDGSSSTLANPAHTFTYPGYYSVGLNVFNNANGCMDYYEDIILIGSRGKDVMADFIYSANEDTRNVQFTDRSKGDIAAYIWDFGDGSAVSNLKNPAYTYQQGGFYYVCLTAVSSQMISATSCKFIQVAADQQNSCLAEFYYTTDSTAVSASFVDESFGNPDAWYWSFGDGKSSTEQNPVHNYDVPGIYLVSMSIANHTSGCTSRYYDLVAVSQGNTGLVGGFGYEVDTSNLKAESYPVEYVGVSLGDAQKFKWSFGDGTVDSTSLQPTHVYTAPGTYYVCFEVSNPISGESSTTCDSVTVGKSSEIGWHDFIMSGVLEVYPNPFRDQARVIYTIEEGSFVDLAVYDLMGRKVKVLVHEQREAGTHEVLLSSNGMEHGIYYLMMNAGHGRITRKLILE